MVSHLQRKSQVQTQVFALIKREWKGVQDNKIFAEYKTSMSDMHKIELTWAKIDHIYEQDNHRKGYKFL